jgi:hypothetical protein
LTAPQALWLAATIALAGPACGLGAASGQSVEVARRWPVPAADVGQWCADMDESRVCWDERGAATAVAREVPAFAATTSQGFRCSGQGRDRTCEARDGAGPFVCDGATCIQRHARQPDDGEWQCADDSGVTVCAGREAASGVAAAAPAPGWICGPRHRSPAAHDVQDSRVCVDLSPDFPEGAATGVRCKWSYERGAQRTCVRDPEAHVIGESCDEKRPCLVGARCAGGRCTPPRPAPSCWLDADCAEGACRLGSCLAVAQWAP